jgi:hypothetical protein
VPQQIDILMERERQKNILCYILGNKCDINDQARKVTIKQGQKLVKDF